MLVMCCFPACGDGSRAREPGRRRSPLFPCMWGWVVGQPGQGYPAKVVSLHVGMGQEAGGCAGATRCGCFPARGDGSAVPDGILAV